jgi:serine/threonine protein kinase
LAFDLVRRTRGIEQDGAAVDLLRRLLAYNPADRITAEEALGHAYFKEVDP